MTERIRIAHGFGGKLSQDLLAEIIHPALAGDGEPFVTLDAAVLENIAPPIVVSTDSFTISPRFFPGGDIGKLAVCGTVNDICMMGAKPQYLSLGLIIEEGFEIDELRTILNSIGDTCRATGSKVITGDTKVVEKGVIDGIFINTTGFGTQVHGSLGPEFIREGDAVLVSGTIGDHGASILNVRENLGFSHTLMSDCAPLNDMLEAAGQTVGGNLHALRDPTRGGLAATLNEFATDTGYQIVINEDAIPVRPEVGSFLEILGLDVLTLANEGKAVLFVAPESAEEACAALRGHRYGTDAAIIGRVETAANRPRVVMETPIGTRRIIEMPLEAGLPRIC